MEHNISKEDMIQVAKELATPIDFNQLIADGILIKSGAWYEVTDWKRLPPHANRQVREVKTSDGKMLVKFTNRTKSAQKLYKKMTGKSPDQK